MFEYTCEVSRVGVKRCVVPLEMVRKRFIHNYCRAGHCLQRSCIESKIAIKIKRQLLSKCGRRICYESESLDDIIACLSLLLDRKQESFFQEVAALRQRYVPR
jgi:hypothetical protein